MDARTGKSGERTTYRGGYQTRRRLAGAMLGCVMVLAGAQAAFGQAPPPPPPPPLQPVPVPPENPITESKRVLGKILFWDEQLSSDNTVACGTCHRPADAGSDARLNSNPGADGIFNTADDVIGSAGVVKMDTNGQVVEDDTFGFDTQVTPRSAQALHGGLFAPSAFWDGRAGTVFTNPESGAVSIPAGGALENQALAPILNNVEMAREGRDWDDVRAKLSGVTPLALATYLTPDMAAAVEDNPSYPALFAAAFGGGQITAERIAFAIATYERTLMPDRTPFDTHTMTPAQRRGLNVLVAPGSRCGACHTPPVFTNNTFRNIGLRPPNEDPGRQEVTGNPADRGRFKVASLRNVGLKKSFMHNGQKASLEEVLDFYQNINGQQQFPQNQDPLIPAINIPPQARADLIEFLRNGLTDPRAAAETFPFDRPILASELGDGNKDGAVDLVDYSIMVSCLTGPNKGPVAGDCRLVDADGDTDVDMEDVSMMQMLLASP